MDDDLVAQFVAITESSPERAQQYLRLSDGNIEQAVELFFSTSGIDLEGSASTTTQTPQPPPVPLESRPSTRQPPRVNIGGVVNLDSDEEIEIDDDDDEPVITGYSSRRTGGVSQAADRRPAHDPPPIPKPNQFEDEDAAMARRMQEEIYAGADMGGMMDAEGYRAPIARTTETLIGPESYDLTNQDELQAAVEEQMRARRRLGQRGRGGAGIFNQRPTSSSIWNDTGSDLNSDEHRANLARATAGASEASSKSTLLAEMYRPPFDLMSRLSWENARLEGKENEKWILVNVQDPAVFDCQVLNRDLWKNTGVKDTVKENFIFMQYSKDDPRGSQYVQYYFQNRESQDAYPHIAIVDPRTGEQVKVWSGPPAPKAMDFLMQLHEFLDRYSLKVTAKNPVAKRKPEPRKEKEVEKMTEEEMLELALQNSLAGSANIPAEKDPDSLTRSIHDTGKGKARLEEADDLDSEMTDAEGGVSLNGHTQSAASPFATISSSKPHTEPPADAASTRIQFRHPTGRVVRRFLLTDPVRRIYEWLKASPLEGREGKEFELISMQKNLVESLEVSIEQAGLKNGTVMVEFVDGS